MGVWLALASAEYGKAGSVGLPVLVGVSEFWPNWSYNNDSNVATLAYSCNDSGEFAMRFSSSANSSADNLPSRYFNINVSTGQPVCFSFINLPEKSH